MKKRACLAIVLALLCLPLPLAAASLVLDNPEAVGSPGAITGWGFTLSGDKSYWLVVTSVQSTFVPYPGGVGAGVGDPVTDYLGNWFLNNGYALAPGGSLSQSFVQGTPGGTGLGLGEFEIRSGAPPGAVEIASLMVTYDLYDGDPNDAGMQVFPEGDPGYLDAQGSVRVADIPEPSTIWMVVLGAGAFALLRRRRLACAALIVAAGSLAALAQPPPLICTASASVPNLIRAGGQAERLQDITLTCGGGMRTPVGAPIPTVNFQLFFSAASTSLISDPTTLPSPASEALLIVDDPAERQPCAVSESPCALFGTTSPLSPYDTKNVFQGVVGSPGVNSVAFLGIPLDPPGMGNQRTLTFTNLRVADAGQPLPYQIQAFINATGPVGFAVTNSQLALDIVLAPLAVAIEDPLVVGQALTPYAFGSCSLWNPELAANPASPVLSNGASFVVKFQEQFPSVLRTRTTAAWPNADTVPLPVPFTVLNMFRTSESIIYHGNPPFPATNGLDKTGLAGHGTRLFIQLEGVPAGVAAFVPRYPPGFNASNSPIRAMLPDAVTGDAGDLTPAAITTTAGPGLLPMTAMPGGKLLAVYETTSFSSLVSNETLRIPVHLAIPGAAGAGTIAVRAGLAPRSAVNVASATDPIPRFADSSVAVPVATLAGGCYVLKLASSPAAGCRFDVSGALSNAAPGSYSLAEAEYTVTALPAAGYIFQSFSGDVFSLTNGIQLNLDAPTSVVANCPACVPSIMAAVTGKSGAASARTWNVRLTNLGSCLASSAQITAITASIIAGPGSVSVTTVPPVAYGNIAGGGGSATRPVVLNFSGTAGTTRARLVLTIKANGGLYTVVRTITNQVP